MLMRMLSGHWTTYTRNNDDWCLTDVAETYEVRDAKNFFEQYYSHVYFLFHEGFTNVEASLAQRGNTSWVLEQLLT